MILDKFVLTGKVALVTGARGLLGAAMAQALAEAGADLAVVSRGDKLTAVAECIQRLGRRCITLQADLAGVASCETVVQQTLEYYGSLDILVNSAGITRRGSIFAISEKDWDDVVNLNLKAVFYSYMPGGSQAYGAAPQRQDHQHRLHALVHGGSSDCPLHGK